MRDLYDMVIQLTDSEAIARDILSTTIEIHVSSVSNKLNEIMKVLTIVTCFVMVPALIAGIYGMNFQHMPEISWEYGYYFALGMMGICMLVLYLFFKRRNWL
jgi:magnesium transporter